MFTMGYNVISCKCNSNTISWELHALGLDHQASLLLAAAGAIFSLFQFSGPGNSATHAIELCVIELVNDLILKFTNITTFTAKSSCIDHLWFPGSWFITGLQLANHMGKRCRGVETEVLGWNVLVTMVTRPFDYLEELSSFDLLICFFKN